MAISAFDLFKIGIGPSSSHTVGPMRASNLFVHRLLNEGLLDQVSRIRVELFGSLGATGKGHGTDKAVLLGLAGYAPDVVNPDEIPAILEVIRAENAVFLSPSHRIGFDEKADLIFHRSETLSLHSNGMRFTGSASDGAEICTQIYYSVGGGFVVSEQVLADGSLQKRIAPDATVLPLPFKTGDELLAQARRSGLSIARIMMQNECHWRSEDEVYAGLLNIWVAMQACVDRGCRTEGILPGGYKVRRRAARLFQTLSKPPEQHAQPDPLRILDWVNLYALAVNEENAAGGRVVTAPTNGAAGVIPAVLHYYVNFVPGSSSQGVVDFLLTAAAIGILYKENASISGAEVGCQGEVGVACSMASAALCAVMGGTPEQVENAAEIGMEHHLGLTCDPVGGLVQIPCIERNAIASVKAINAARMALHGDGTHYVSLDKVIKTMKETGADMMTKYKETSRGGLAVNIIEC